MFVWWGSEVECVSALARLEREGILDELTVSLALDRLRQFASTWQEIDASDALREAALRAADALQLAAAYLASERRPSSLEFVTLDERLAIAARKEGFAVTGISLE